MNSATVVAGLTASLTLLACGDRTPSPMASPLEPSADIVTDTGSLTASLTATDFNGFAGTQPIVLTGTASGGSGRYEYRFYAKYCEDKHPCDTFYFNFATVQGGSTAQATRNIDPMTVWEVFFVLQVRDSVTGNVYRTAARGTDVSGYGNIPEPEPIHGTDFCSPMKSYPFTTYYTDSAGATALRNFNRDPSTGAKRWEPPPQ